MVKLNFRIDDRVHARLLERAYAAELSLSAFVRSVLTQAADPGRGYIFSSKDEILATCIQILSIIAVSVDADLLDRGMAEARVLLGERGLLDPEAGSFPSPSDVPAYHERRR